MNGLRVDLVRNSRTSTCGPADPAQWAAQGAHGVPASHGDFCSKPQDRGSNSSRVTHHHHQHHSGGGPEMAYQEDIALMAHLMRRAGFSAGRDELETRAAKGYEATVEDLLHPETQPPVDAYTLMRYQPASLLPGGQPPMGNVNWMYYLINT